MSTCTLPSWLLVHLQVGALTVYFLGPFPLPAMVVNGLLRAAHLIPDEYPPHRLSGATLAVQRQQRVNLVESVMIELQVNIIQSMSCQSCVKDIHSICVNILDCVPLVSL